MVIDIELTLNRFGFGKIAENKKILVDSHGTIMSIYFAKISGAQKDIFGIWERLGFCDYGVVSGGSYCFVRSSGK